MTYSEEYDAILNYPLPPKMALALYNAYAKRFKFPEWLSFLFEETHLPNIKDIRVKVAEVVQNDYRNRLDYLLAENNKERAVAAVKGPRNDTKKAVVDIWKRITSELTTFDKIMLGWDRV